MTTKHTPAPWSTRWVLRGENRLQVAIEFHKEVTVDETTANLKLISAAPDLLEALIDVLDAFERHTAGHSRGYELNTVICEQAKNAIAKATQ
jgi:hypothetical protein